MTFDEFWDIIGEARDSAGKISEIPAWPNVGSYTLQQTTNLATAGWVACNCSITDNALSNFCTVTPLGGDLFFRLKQ